MKIQMMFYSAAALCFYAAEWLLFAASMEMGCMVLATGLACLLVGLIYHVKAVNCQQIYVAPAAEETVGVSC